METANLGTERINEATKNIDLCTTIEMVQLMNEQDITVPYAVKEQLPQIANAVDVIHSALKNGGRMVYIGAGTSGRLGVLDASECPPTFGTPPEMVQGYIAGGDIALRNAVEGCEDNEEEGKKLIEEINISEKDVVIGITASGSAPFVLSAVKTAKERGAKTIGIVTNKSTKLENLADICIAPVVGAETIVGSTRLKSGTAQKLVLNMLTTCTMVKLGKVYGNLMVDLKPGNNKLIDRAQRIICEVTNVDMQIAKQKLNEANNSTKLAIMMIESGLDATKAKKLLDENDGVLRKALQNV